MLELAKVLENLDQEHHVASDTGYHIKRSAQKDLRMIVTVLHDEMHAASAIGQRSSNLISTVSLMMSLNYGFMTVLRKYSVIIIDYKIARIFFEEHLHMLHFNEHTSQQLQSVNGEILNF